MVGVVERANCYHRGVQEQDGQQHAQQPIWKQAGPAGVLAVAWALLPAVFGLVLLSQIGLASEWLDARPSTGVLVYALVFAVTSGCGVLPTYAQAVLGGWVFGVAVGLPAALAGFAGGALLGYAITRAVARHRVERMIDRNPKAVAVRDSLIGKGFWKTLLIVFLIRVPPNSPFSLTNLAMASSGVSLPVYLVGTILGMTPRTAVAVAFAATASSTGAVDIQTFVAEKGFLPIVIGIVLMVIVIAIIGAMAKRALNRVTGDEPSPLEQ